MTVSEFLAGFAGSKLVEYASVPVGEKYYTLLFLPLVVLLVCCYLYFIVKDTRKLKRFLFVVIVASLLAIALKSGYAEARPCVGEVFCVSGNGFPSSHAASGFAVAFGLMETALFPFGLLFAIYVSLMRVLTGVHTIPQIAAGMALAYIVYMLLKEFTRKEVKETASNAENLRKVVHFAFGILAVAFFAFVEFELAVLISSIVFLVCVYFKYVVDLNKVSRNPFAFLERKGAEFGKGAFAFAAVLLVNVLFARPLQEGLAVIAVLAAGDAASALIGRMHEKDRLIGVNERKSVKGTLAFIAAGLIAASFFIPIQKALILSVILGFVEIAPVKIDDNLTVGLIGLGVTFLI